MYLEVKGNYSLGLKKIPNLPPEIPLPHVYLQRYCLNILSYFIETCFRTIQIW